MEIFKPPSQNSKTGEISYALPYLYYSLLGAAFLALSFSLYSLSSAFFLNSQSDTTPLSKIWTSVFNLFIAAQLGFVTYLVRKGFVQLALKLMIVSGITFIWIAAAQQNGFDDTVLVFMFVILIVTAAYLDRDMLSAAATLSIISVISLFAFERAGILNTNSPAPLFSELIFFIVALLMSTAFLRVTLIRSREQSQNLNLKTQELELSQEALQNYQSHLEELVTARTMELLIAKNRAEDANQTKSKFLANMSHELRTPLNAIIGYSEIITDEAADEINIDMLVSDANKIGQAGKHLLSLINNLLDISKIESDQFDLDYELIDINRMLSEIEAFAAPIIAQNGNTFSIDRTGLPNNLNLISDEARIKQIILNLLGNAAKFTTQGEVSLKLQAFSQSISIQVTDTGIGIKPEFISKIFDRFAQADDSINKRYEGTGLGLAITKQLCELMGGFISVQSEYGQGTVFTVELPLRPTVIMPTPPL